MVSKLVAGREKDYEFAWVLIETGLVETAVLIERAEQLETVPAVKRRLQRWVWSCAERLAAGRATEN